MKGNQTERQRKEAASKEVQALNDRTSEKGAERKGTVASKNNKSKTNLKKKIAELKDMSKNVELTKGFINAQEVPEDIQYAIVDIVQGYEKKYGICIPKIVYRDDSEESGVPLRWDIRRERMNIT